MNSIVPEEKTTDLSSQLKEEVKKIICNAFEGAKSEKTITDIIKTKLEEKDEGKWNVVIGKDFGTHVSHKSGKYGLFQVKELCILLWQTG